MGSFPEQPLVIEPKSKGVDRLTFGREGVLGDFNASQFFHDP